MKDRSGFVRAFLLAVSMLLACFSPAPHGLALGVQAAEVLSPSQYLGKNIGADGILADYDEIWRYFSYLDSVSDWIEVSSLGRTTLGKDFLMAVASHPSNLEKTEHYLAISKSLRDAHGVSGEGAAALAQDGKVIMLDMSAIHSDEVAATQMALDLAYRIARGDPEIVPYLEDVILLIIPSVNPDGHKMIVEWYNRWKGTEYDGSGLPWLYHPYAGHDDNRDWYMFNLAETRLVSRVMYDTWIPQVILDHHQMWMTGARIFVPPYTDPVNPNIDPLLWREIELVGSAMHLKLQENGCKGVIHGASFPGWWEGASVMTPLWHNVVSLLTEAASVRTATPIYVDPSELGAWGTGFPKYTKLSNFPDPWPGGWWRLKDIMNYELVSTIGALEACSKNRETILLNFYRMTSSAIEKGRREKPYAYIVPPSDDEFTARRMLERLMLGGVEIHRALKEFSAGGRTYPGGSHIIFLSQPYRSYAKDMLERQHYPEIRLAPEAPPLEPYDATAWTMPLKMGVESAEIDQPFEAEVQRCVAIESPESRIPQPTDASSKSGQSDRYVAVSRNSLGAYLFANRALKSSLELYTTRDTLTVAGADVLPGSLVVPLGKDPEVTLDRVREMTDGLGLEFQSVKIANSARLKPLKRVRLGIFEPYAVSDPAGWIKYVLEDFGFEYKVLRNEDIKRGLLSKSFDVIVLHDTDPGIIKDGKPTGWGAEYFEPLPPEYSGGIGDDGVKNLKAFVESGGMLITTAASCDFALKEFELPAKNVLKDVPQKSFHCPGAILNLAVAPTSEVGYGARQETPCLFFYSSAFSTRMPYGKFGREVVARYADTDLLLSGWITGEDMITGKPAVVKMGYGKGDIIITGFDPIHRAQTYSTYRILFNSILAGATAR